MPTVPQIESPNVLTLDFADNGDLREILSHKEAGDKIVLTMHLQVMSKGNETAQLAIEKIITDPSDYLTDEAEPSIKEPIMASMKRSRREKEMPMGKHNRPPQTAENSAEPWMKSYV